MKRGLRFPLWVKLTLAGLLGQGLMLVLLIAGSLHLIENELADQSRESVRGAAPLLNAALAGPLMQRDYVGLKEILDEARASERYVYLLLLDAQGRRVAASGIDQNADMPVLDAAIDWKNGDHVYDTRIPILLASTPYGELRFGVDTRRLSEARHQVMHLGMLIGLVGLALTFLTLASTGYLLTRRLNQLTRASQALSEQNFDVSLPVQGNDEVGQLVDTFRVMSQQLHARLQALERSEERFYAIAHYTYDMELWINPEGRTIWVNPSVKRMTGFTPDEVLELADFPLSLVAEETRPEAARRLAEALSGRAGEGYQFLMGRKDGSQFWAAVNWHPLYDGNNQFLGIRASVRDVTDLKATQERALEYLASTEAERARLMALLSAMNLGILFVGMDGRVIYHNPAFNYVWRLPERDLVGIEALSVFSPCLASDPEDFRAHLTDLLRHPEDASSLEIKMDNGRIVTQQSYAVRDREGRFIGHLWIYEDITSERQTAERLLYLAERDSLTGLFNRHRFQLELERTLIESARHRVPAALLYFDLDEFKAINDHFGHKAGDAMLIRVAGEVSGLTRRNEMLFRLGGDEFAVLMPGADRNQAENLATRIVRAIAQIPFRMDDQTLHISSSLGIAHYPEHATDQDQLVACADAAMYQAKHAGKNAWRVYRADLDTTPEMVNRLSWNERLTRALNQDLFELHYQGVYQTRTRRLLHLEALLRLRDEGDGELIAPDMFIPVAEKSNKIMEIDRWVLSRIVRTLAEHPQAPPIAVNISGRSLDDPELPAYITQLMEEHRIDPARLMVEITETAAVSDLADAERFIEAIKRTGCRVCLDDFGAGFASFAYLKHIRVDAIKLDGMFIRNLTHDHDNQVFVRGIVEVARGLGKTSIAECVEDEETLRLLNELGVDKAQGYHLDRPQARHPALFHEEPPNAA